MVCCVPFALPVTVMAYVPAGVPVGPPPLLDVLPPPHAAWNRQPANITMTALRASSFLCWSFASPDAPSSIAGMKKPNASSRPREWDAMPAASTLEAAVVATVRVALPVSFVTEIAPSEHVGAGFTTGAMLQVKVTPDGLNPLVGVMATVEVADWPGFMEASDNAVAERLKSAETLTALDVLPL